MPTTIYAADQITIINNAGETASRAPIIDAEAVTKKTFALADLEEAPETGHGKTEILTAYEDQIRQGIALGVSMRKLWLMTREKGYKGNVDSFTAFFKAPETQTQPEEATPPAPAPALPEPPAPEQIEIAPMPADPAPRTRPKIELTRKDEIALRAEIAKIEAKRSEEITAEREKIAALREELEAAQAKLSALLTEEKAEIDHARKTAELAARKNRHTAAPFPLARSLFTAAKRPGRSPKLQKI